MARWLFVCAAMVFLMVILGGATRLTESGLSMVEWKPLTILPPLTEADWTAEFAAYQKYPEYQKVNTWMELDDFKQIYWLEYLHRLWGRALGLVFFVPFAWFVWKRKVDRARFWKFAGLFALGGAQGVLGWYMVASGLVDRPDVSHYRLAAHLLTAFVCFGLMLWVALGLWHADADPARHDGSERLLMLVRTVALFALVVVTSGAFVAGLDAGKGYNTFPLMDGALIPSGLYAMAPWWMNWLENHMTIQFNHRVLAMTLVALIAAVWWRARAIDRSSQVRRWVDALAIMALVQATLGVITLLLVVPIGWALAHQTGAQIVFALAVVCWHSLAAPERAAVPRLASAPAE
jgi:cytochrome c oxidase assembly protein subunit 15